MNEDNYVKTLKLKMHDLTRATYRATKGFPKEELFAASSPLRRTILSVPLNFIEGYARRRRAVKLNFWETSYGSLKESQYLIYFAFTESWIPKETYTQLTKQCDEVAAMLWTAITSLEAKPETV